ncbi:DNA methyltransferase [Methylotenera sp.]|uniref:DNA methyltransferase n=1 Tax=Methylotenera sp. TaxID=2051956 RepID=UPI0027243E39|nr:DNA methyltransferase [Methylotenera sp.]MDO9204374.1 DNA methyltransferase [Methylotenera sp.]MDP1523346.1 DNA methyltransferase [Methylotenera sp.]MDP1658347.1 DNA methyltransferase [Methylotenera sp.]MDP3308853.1 DNA methyltransferase [Methylotenera sp.]MDP3819489.1 DNA methyltransferase [Methylotenera sp.]
MTNSNPINDLILGDNLEIMATMPDNHVDFILTDPPYLVNYIDRSQRSIKNDINADWLMPTFYEMYRVLKPDSFMVSFYGWTKIDLFFAAWKAAGFHVVGHIVFPKRYASSAGFLAYQHESAYLLAKGHPAKPAKPLSDVGSWYYSGNKLHPTQKPISALTPFIQSFTPENGLVLDPFAGSASTCEAAKLCGRQYIGIEIDQQYFDLAKARLDSLSSREIIAA